MVSSIATEVGVAMHVRDICHSDLGKRAKEIPCYLKCEP